MAWAIREDTIHTRYIPGAAAPASVLLELTPASVDTILDRAADRTCRLDVFKEVYLVSTPAHDDRELFVVHRQKF